MSEWDSDEGIAKGLVQIGVSIALSIIIWNLAAHIAWWYCGRNGDLAYNIGEAVGWSFAFISAHLICRNRW